MPKDKSVFRKKKSVFKHSGKVSTFLRSARVAGLKQDLRYNTNKIKELKSQNREIKKLVKYLSP